MNPSFEGQARLDVDFCLRALRICLAIDRWEIQLRGLYRDIGLDDTRSMRNWKLAALRFKSALLRYAEQKAGFREDQPRWPAGSGRISGRWSGGGGGAGTGDVTELGSHRRDRRDGHHFLPRAHYRNLPFSKEVRKVFDDAKTGPLRNIHGWDEPHVRYNEATKEIMERFMQTHGIQPEKMTVDQARSFVREIHESRDPRIRNFNMKIKLREYLYRLRARTRGNE